MIIESPNGMYNFRVNKDIYNILMRFKNKVTKDDSEVWIAAQGDTGCGKSLTMFQWSYIMTGKMIPLKNICFSIDEFVTAVIDAKKGDVVVCDEAISIFFSRASMTKGGRLVGEVSNQIRQKNLIIILCLPDVLNLDYIAQKKLNAIIHLWEDRRLKGDRYVTHKANVAMYLKHPSLPQTQMLINYLKAKKRNPLVKMKKPEPWYHQQGCPIGENCKKPWYPVIEGEEAYKIKKESVLDKYDKSKECNKIEIDKDKLTKRVVYLREYEKKTFKQIGKELKKPISTIHDYYKAYTKENSEISANKYISERGVADKVNKEENIEKPRYLPNLNKEKGFFMAKGY